MCNAGSGPRFDVNAIAHSTADIECIWIASYLKRNAFTFAMNNMNSLTNILTKYIE